MKKRELEAELERLKRRMDELERQQFFPVVQPIIVQPYPARPNDYWPRPWQWPYICETTTGSPFLMSPWEIYCTAQGVVQNPGV